MARVYGSNIAEDSNIVEMANLLENRERKPIEGESHHEKENEIKQNTLTQAKDRGQVTATTAMSIVNVALLKTLLDQDPALNKYYYASLGLIIASLTLQILAGFLSLMVAAIQSYYKKHHDDFCEDIFEFLCCCQLRRKSERPALNIYNPAFRGTADDSTAADDNNKTTGCCPCRMTTTRFSAYEYDILETYEQWCSSKVNVELRQMEAETKVKYLTNVADNLKSRIDAAQKQAVDNPTVDNELSRKISELQSELNNNEKEIQACAASRMTSEIVREQGDLLYRYADEIRKSHLLKSVSFWQNMLNYILYFVFILNSFITGLGLATPSPNSTSGAMETTTSVLQ